MLHKIKKLLELTPGLKAKEIAKNLGLDRHDINSFLHHNLEHFQKDANFCWYLSNQELTITFDQNTWVNCSQFEQALANSESPLESSYKSIVFVIPTGCNLLLESIARLMALSNQLVLDGKEVTINFRQSKTFTYVDRIGFFDHLNLAVHVLPERPKTSSAKRYNRNSDSLVELGIIDPKNLDESLPARLKEVFVGHAGSRYEQTAFTVISELLGNVRDHSLSPIPGFVGLQFYKNSPSPHIQTVISDSGKGILGTLKPILDKKYPDLAREIDDSKLDSDIFLLKKVLTQGQISQSEDEGHGLGLKRSSDAASKFNANISIRQERCELKLLFRQGKRTKFESKVGMPLIRGTHICFDFELDREL